MNARERQSYGDAIIRALVRVRDEHNQTDNRLLLECLLRELPRLIDCNNFDQRTKRAKNFKTILDDLTIARQAINDYLLEYK